MRGEAETGRGREGDGPEVKPLIFDGVRLAVFVEEEIAQDILLLRTGASETKETERDGEAGRERSISLGILSDQLQEREGAGILERRRLHEKGEVQLTHLRQDNDDRVL